MPLISEFDIVQRLRHDPEITPLGFRILMAVQWHLLAWFLKMPDPSYYNPEVGSTVDAIFFEKT